jgi:hypothetical protein
MIGADLALVELSWERSGMQVIRLVTRDLRIFVHIYACISNSAVSALALGAGGSRHSTVRAAQTTFPVSANRRKANLTDHPAIRFVRVCALQ